jgi:hypothetical protein
MIDRLRCLINGHPWPDWSAWTSAGRGRFYRERHCPRCHRHETEDG